MDFKGSAPATVNDDNPRLCSGHNLIPALLEKLEVPELRQLLEIRQQGWDNKNLDRTFAEQRATAIAPSKNVKRAWFTLMKKAFEELNSFASFVPVSGQYNFLDLGCCPGGFSSYILSLNAGARGVGISLPVSQGGHEYTLEHWLRPRLKLQWADMTYFQLHPTAHELRGNTLVPFPDTYRDFDLVILDGHYLHDLYQTPAFEKPESWDTHRLWVSQMIIALKSIKDGGTLVVKLSHVEWTTTAQTLFLLDVLSSSLDTYKPRIIHAKRGTFYAIARGVGYGPRGELKQQYIRQYETLWYDLAFGGEDGKGRRSTKDDLGFVVTYEDLVDQYLERLAELGMDPWVVQTGALRKLLKTV